VPLPVLSLMLVVFGLTTGEFVVAGILPDVAAGLAVPVPAAGRLVTSYALGMIVGGPVVTVLTARPPGRRRETRRHLRPGTPPNRRPPPTPPVHDLTASTSAGFVQEESGCDPQKLVASFRRWPT
jgi:hypothetical protein